MPNGAAGAGADGLMDGGGGGACGVPVRMASGECASASGCLLVSCMSDIISWLSTCLP
jgi:hypothetical protein